MALWDVCLIQCTTVLVCVILKIFPSVHVICVCCLIFALTPIARERLLRLEFGGEFFDNLFATFGSSTSALVMAGYSVVAAVPRTVPLKCDNQSTTKQSINQVDQRRCRHLGMRSHYLRQQRHAGHLRLEYVPSADQRRGTPQHETLRSTLKVTSTADFRCSSYKSDKQH